MISERCRAGDGRVEGQLEVIGPQEQQARRRSLRRHRGHILSLRHAQLATPNSIHSIILRYVEYIQSLVKA